MLFLLLLLAVSTVSHITGYEECEGNLCPLSVSKPQVLSAGNTLPALIGLDEKSGCICRGRNHIHSVCFGRSRCNSMPKTLILAAPALKLTNTHITQLLPGDFERLGHLLDLQIEGNYELRRISPGTFRNLSKLTDLSISYNNNLNTLHGDLFMGMTSLKRLFLNNNGFSSIKDITYAARPAALPNLLTLILDSNGLINIEKDSFKSMENSSLEELSMALCRIDDIHPNALVPLKKLKILQLGENSLNSTVVTDVLKEMLKANIDLRVLNLFSMGFKKSPPRQMMEIIAKSNISHLNLSRNQFEALTNNSFPLMPNLEFLDLREVLAFSISDDAFSNLPNLKTLLISKNKLSFIPKGILVLQNLTFLDMQENSPAESYHYYFKLQHEQFYNMKNLAYLNLGYNGMAHVFDTSFVGLKHLQVLELKNSSIFHIEKNSFLPLENLKKLNLMNNFLIHADAVPDVFAPLKNLEVLLLGGCKLKYVTIEKQDPFKHLRKLKYLGLERNHLTTIAPGDFKSLIGIRQIDLSYNMLNSWEQRIFAYNKNLTRVVASKNKISDISLAMFEDFSRLKSVDLDQNVIHCSCFATYESHKQFMRGCIQEGGFFNASVFDPPVYCTYPDILDNVTLMDYLTKEEYASTICVLMPEKLLLILPLAVVAILISIMAGLIFYYRWHIKYWIFLSKLYLSRKGKIRPKRDKTGYHNYEYDAFVSYSTEDRDFVAQMVAMLENNEPFFRLCVYERDFQIGTIISESILESVAKSRKTLLIISDNYAKSQWCRWETQICEHHRLFFENEDGEYVDDSLILIKLNTVSEHHLTPTLKYLLKTRIYLQWEFGERKQETFWDRLRNTLGPTKVLSEITHM
ncbi:uncharacterized protein LOC143196138 [Rhynchophorus ferrugineus]|uniref:uncharacterized protein LOC143196138 n=1 Tax=Rhynchophorus ferrugineus TaxID=354439 RepID=UPI003FCDC0B3